VSVAVGVMARTPESGGKTRLAPHLSPARLTALRRALLSDTLRALDSVPDVTIFCTPDQGGQEIAALDAGKRRTVPQGDGDLGVRMLRALQHLLSQSDAAILVGSDVPLLTADHIREAAELLSDGRVVIGPADDGGYYLIGMTTAHAGVFEEIEWGTESVLTDTLRAADRAGVAVHLIRSAYDIDTIDDLLRIERDLKWAPSVACEDLRRWLLNE
jgi:rSAM/selenodomain-associated transferase 1